MSTLKSSTTMTKRCQNYVKRLDKQIQTISNQVTEFNENQNSSIFKRARTRSHLKKLSEPKYQHILLNKQLNPEFIRVQPNSKINKLFKNCSAISQSNFGFVNRSVFFGGTQSVLMDISVKKMSQTQKKLDKKLRVLQQSWNKIQQFRVTNDLSTPQILPNTDKKTKSILQRVQKKRPTTTSTARTLVLQSNIWGIQSKIQI